MTNTHKFTITLTEVEHERLVRLIAGRIERDQPKTVSLTLSKATVGKDF